MFGICSAIICPVQNFTQTEAPASDQLMRTCLLTPAVGDPRRVTSAGFLVVVAFVHDCYLLPKLTYSLERITLA